MSAEIIYINNNKPDLKLIKKAAAAINAGKLVIIPTETVYGIAANADSSSAMKKLRKFKKREDKSPFTIHLHDFDQVDSYIQDISDPARRLANRYWAGPLTLVFPNIGPYGLGLRVVGDKIAQMILKEVKVPVVATSANLPGDKPAVSGIEAIDKLSNHVDFIVDSGPAQFQDSSSVVAIAKQAFSVRREGVIGIENIIKAARIMAYVVCEGNIIRSPMTRALLLHLIDQDAHANLGENFRRAIKIESAGISASTGEHIVTEAIEVLTEYKAEEYVKNHRAQTFHRGMLEDADKVFVMTKSQLKIVRGYDKYLAPKVHMLDPDGKDIADPVGKSKEAHRRAARHILRALQKRFFSSS